MFDYCIVYIRIDSSNAADCSLWSSWSTLHSGWHCGSSPLSSQYSPLDASERLDTSNRQCRQLSTVDVEMLLARSLRESTPSVVIDALLRESD